MSKTSNIPKRRHFTVEFLVGERLAHLKSSHLALAADDLIPEHIMQHVYGKEPERQVCLCGAGDVVVVVVVNAAVAVDSFSF